MNRISTNMANNDMQHYNRLRDSQMNRVQNQMGSGRRIQNLRDAPLDAAYSAKFQSNLRRVEHYQKNISYVQGRYDQAETFMNEGLLVMQRIKEIAVQAANGTYSQEEREYMAFEVNQLLERMVELGNMTGDNGIKLFGGSDNKSAPFTTSMGRANGLEGAVITNVHYTGSQETNPVEISDGATIDSAFPGDGVFWAENQQIFAAVDSRGYVVQEDTTFTLDGTTINLQAGDNTQNIIHKINASNAAVKASMDPVTGGLVLNTTIAHQIHIDEADNNTVLKDLGLLSDVGNRPPENIHPDATVSGGSLFDTVIELRDNLLSGDYQLIGTQSLGSIDEGYHTLLRNITDIGTKTHRLTVTQSRLDKLSLDITKNESNLADLDMTEAAVDLSMYEYLQKASYQVAGKILRPTLMDFLR